MTEPLLTREAEDLAARVKVLEAALAAEKLDHLATMKRWVKIAERQARAIAKARKLLRGAGVETMAVSLNVRCAYRALDWRQR